MRIRELVLGVLIAASCSHPAAQLTDPVDYVNPLVGTASTYEISTGNTYPAVAVPWGMNFWTPQTGRDGDGWTYRYDATHIRGLKQTHQPSPWINDYGAFSLMPVTTGPVYDQDARASWFSHKAEVATPYYYSVYLADHDVTAELTPTSHAAAFRLTYPEDRLFISQAVETKIDEVEDLLVNPKLRWLFRNCFPNTLDTTVHYSEDENGTPRDKIYRNTRKFVWSEDNPFFFKGKAGEGIGGPHIGYDMVWPMSIMMKAFTATDDAEIKWCIETLLDTDAGTGFIHESFHKDDASRFTRPWFAWQNTLFGELILDLIDRGKLRILNSIDIQ